MSYVYLYLLKQINKNMTVYVFHTPTVASPINDRRAGTYRIGSDNPNPIKITKGWDAELYFAFRDHRQHAVHTIGLVITARIFNTENTEVWSNNLVADTMTAGAATLMLDDVSTGTFSAGLYSMVIEYTDNFGKTHLAQTHHRHSRFVVEVIDITTFSPNN
jgi:hypothetical protein